MKISKVNFALFVLGCTIFLSSCSKEKPILKDIDGTWNVTSYEIDNNTIPYLVEGTWIFDSCSKKTNKESTCDGNFNYILSSGSVSDTINNDFVYRIDYIDKDSTVLYIEDANYEILELEDNRLRLSLYTDNFETHNITLTK